MQEEEARQDGDKANFEAIPQAEPSVSHSMEDSSVIALAMRKTQSALLSSPKNQGGSAAKMRKSFDPNAESTQFTKEKLAYSPTKRTTLG